MIRHDYAGCATCHADPSGAGVLTPYGRAQSAILLSSHYKGEVDVDAGGPQDFLFGLVTMPDWLLMQGWVRNAYIWDYANGSLADNRVLQMVADLGAHISLGAFRAGGTIGYNSAETAALSDLAWLTPAATWGNIVSREHWLGLSLLDDAMLVRAGRINMPFGLRNIEHTSWVRSETRTDINQSQQDGVAVAYSNDWIRGEIMGIAGNYQVNPDAYRERGYSAFAEIAVAPRYGVGASSLVAHSSTDILTGSPTTRQAHGIFARAAPIEQLTFLGEFDALLRADKTDSSIRAGYVGFLQADVEPIQGLHGMLTGEILDRGGPSEYLNLGLWVSAAWFVIPHVDVRVDAIRRSVSGAPTAQPTITTYLMQLHVYI